MAVPTTLSVGSRTPIESATDVSFCGSPLHLTLQNSTFDATLQKVTVYLWVWTGNQNKVLGSPNYILKKDKISASDKYIQLEITDLVKPFIKPTFYYNIAGTTPNVNGQGVFWQIVADIESEDTIVRTNYRTSFCTLGYRWSYEQTAYNGWNSNGVQRYGSLLFPESVNLKYDPRVPNYFTQDFDFSKSVATATTDNIIAKSTVTPTASQLKCQKDPTLIVYLDKRGLFESFTPFGKITVPTKIDNQITNKSYRNPQYVDTFFQHLKAKNNIDVMQSYIINTGALSQGDVQVIEEILYSPLVILIKFSGGVYTSTQIGTTIDSTTITIDDTDITIDSVTITETIVGKYDLHYQIPVVVTDSDFVRKTRLNDKNEVNYNIKFEETTSKILDIR